MKKMRLTQEEVLNLRVLELEQQVRDKTIQFLLLQKEIYLKNIDPDGKLSKFTEQIKKEMEEKTKFLDQYNNQMNKIGEKFKIDIKQYGYDDETGALIKRV